MRNCRSIATRLNIAWGIYSAQFRRDFRGENCNCRPVKSEVST